MHITSLTPLLRRATLPELTDEIRDEGLCLYALERYSECAEALREYLEADPRAGDRADVRFSEMFLHERILQGVPLFHKLLVGICAVPCFPQPCLDVKGPVTLQPRGVAVELFKCQCRRLNRCSTGCSGRS